MNKESVEQSGGDERAAFEAWLAQAMSHHFDPDLDLAKYEDSGEYRYNPAADYWKAWQARAALAQPSPAQAEAERPEVAEVAFVLRNIGAMDAEDIDGDNVDLRFEDAEGRDTGCDVSIVEYAEKAADLFEQHARIVGALRADRDSWAEQAEQRLADWDEMRKERDAALARVAALESKLAELEKQEPVAWGAFHFGGKRDGKLYTHCETEAQIEAYILDMHRSSDSLTLSKGPLYAAPVDQAQHSVPEGWKLVPIEPTLEMLDARRDCEDGIDGYLVEDTEYYFPDRGAVRDFLACVYRGMLAAAPGKEVGHE
ncbi:hypothetical protein [Pseudomonas aeruginosa]|uniref:hypothetical protein n=1 Tax=Pseudomonas aeruginosa TaxID=287 RepID=UPI002E193CC0|nr:hypothetical protein [Pseudomonas aeruginosa]